MKCAFCSEKSRLLRCRLCLRTICIKHRVRVEDGHKALCKWDCVPLQQKENKNALVGK